MMAARQVKWMRLFPQLATLYILCVTCHNAVTFTKTTVMFPSGVEIKAGDDVRCMECHQGRESKVSVDTQIEKFAVTDMDAMS